MIGKLYMWGDFIFICSECGAIFEKPKIYTETHGLDSPPYETFYGCPICGGSFNKTFKCDGCGEWVNDCYVEILPSDEKYCENCYILKNIED